MIEVKFYDEAADPLLKFAVIVARSQGKWVFCTHRDRSTYEIPGGHREPGESILDAARRELHEETGAVDFSIRPVCVYSVTGKSRVNASGEESFGMLYAAEITGFESELHSEMERVVLLEELPDQWTYPLIQPQLIREWERRKAHRPLVELRERTEQHARVYFEKAQDPEIRAMLPQSVTTLEQALENYRKTLLPGATSYGRTIYADGVYVGDIWCYGIDPAGEPGAMISYCIFEKSCWNLGVMSTALECFMTDIARRFRISSVGAFAYAANAASIRVLEKSGFTVREAFVENGTQSKYLQSEITEEFS